MEKHLGIRSSTNGEFDSVLLVTEQASLLVVYLMLQSQAYDILERPGQLRGTGRELVSTAHIPFQRFMSTPSMQSAADPHTTVVWGHHGLLLGLAVT